MKFTSHLIKDVPVMLQFVRGKPKWNCCSKYYVSEMLLQCSFEKEIVIQPWVREIFYDQKKAPFLPLANRFDNVIVLLRESSHFKIQI